MKTDFVKTAIIGGGASGLFCALLLKNSAVVLEKGPRAGRKLSATGNGQGNLSNAVMNADCYFPEKNRGFVRRALERFGSVQTLARFEKEGIIFVADEKGRVYPAGRQASAITDLLRYGLRPPQKTTVTGCEAVTLSKKDGLFETHCVVAGEKRIFRSENVVVCTGGKAAPNFGSDGSGYKFAKAFGHTVTPLFPSLVQLKTDTTYTKTLKGKRAFCKARATAGNKILAEVEGDVIFTDYGISGDAVFRLSAFAAGREEKVGITLDFLPMSDAERLKKALDAKKRGGIVPPGELFLGILDNQIGRAVMKRAAETGEDCVFLAKNFTLDVTGTLNFDYAQVTKGGIPADELTDGMESRKQKGLFFAGEIIDVDGMCGGYNLQWAFTSAAIAAESINNSR